MAYRNNRLMSGKSQISQRSNTHALPPRDPREAQYISQKDLHERMAVQARGQQNNRNFNYLHSKMQS